MPRLLVKLMGVTERKKKLVLKALAFSGGFHEAGKNNESKVEALVANIRVAVIAKGKVLNNLIAAFAEVHVEVKEVERIVVREAEIPVIAFLAGIGYGDAGIEDGSLDEVLLRRYLHLGYELVAFYILAVYVQYGVPVDRGLPRHVGIFDGDVLYRVGQLVLQE
jgi:hypothetical protein